MNLWSWLATCSVACFEKGAAQEARGVITVSNVEPRLDDTGEVVPLADGSLVAYGGKYYLYGVVYQPCPVSEQPSCYNPCGYYNNSFGVWESPDLVLWKRGALSVIPAMDEGDSPLSSSKVVYFSPFVVFNPAVNKFVMWFQMYFAQRAVATADSPLGPFTIVRMPGETGLAPSLLNGSSVYVFVDGEDQGGDGTAYLQHNIIVRDNETTPATYVSRLSSDFTKVVETHPVRWDCSPPAHSMPLGRNSKCMQEGGGIFKTRFNETLPYVWYILAGNGCCFCALGGDSKYWRSEAGPLGPYHFIGYVNKPLPNPPNTSYTPYTVPAQQFGVHKVPTVDEATGRKRVANLYIGMRWGSALDGRKDHDFQYWSPLQVGPGGEIEEMRWRDNFTLTLP